jgi:hypothetical protein
VVVPTDNSRAVVTPSPKADEIAAARPHVTSREDRELELILRWSYGSAFGLWHGVLRRIVPEPWWSVALGGTLMRSAAAARRA